MNGQWNKYEKMRRFVDPLIFALRDMAYATPRKFDQHRRQGPMGVEAAEYPTEMVASHKKFSMGQHGRVCGRYFDLRKRITSELVRDDAGSKAVRMYARRPAPPPRSDSDLERERDRIENVNDIMEYHKKKLAM